MQNLDDIKFLKLLSLVISLVTITYRMLWTFDTFEGGSRKTPAIKLIFLYYYKIFYNSLKYS